MVTTSTPTRKRTAAAPAQTPSLLKMTKWSPQTLPPHPDDKDKSVPSIKKLNAMTDSQVHQFLPPSVPGLDMDMFERLKKLNFHNWADFHHSVKAPVAVARGVQAHLKDLLDPTIEAEAEKSWELYACKFDDDSDKDEPVAKTAVALPISKEAKEVRC